MSANRQNQSQRSVRSEGNNYIPQLIAFAVMLLTSFALLGLCAVSFKSLILTAFTLVFQLQLKSV